MKVINAILKPLNLQLSKVVPFNPFEKSEWKIEHAFESVGVDYYMFSDPFNIPAERALQSLNFYKEMEMCVSRDELMKWLDKVDAILNPPAGRTIKIGEVALITTVLKQKLEFLTEPDLIWRLGSVVYFDKSENPGRFDYKYASEKVQKWKSDMTVDVFFSLSRFYKWIPSLNTSHGNILTYLNQVQEVKDEHQKVFSQLNSQQRSKGQQTAASVKNSL